MDREPQKTMEDKRQEWGRARVWVLEVIFRECGDTLQSIVLSTITKGKGLNIEHSLKEKNRCLQCQCQAYKNGGKGPNTGISETLGRVGPRQA